MRLFVAVNFDDKTKSCLLAIQDKIKKQAVRGNFSKPENFHLTLVFLGETDTGLVQAISAVIKDTVSPSAADRAGQNAFPVTFSRTGCFRHSGKELWWIGAGSAGQAGGAENEDASGLRSLNDLHRRIACGLETEGISFDKRAFRAHITLGREIKPSTPIILSGERITVPVNRVSLMKSEHIGGAVIYTELFGQDLGQSKM